jgi:glycosyltransferase involved in cell wall biosynthesis
MTIFKVANIIEEGRLGGPQVRIAEVANKLKSVGVETTVIYPFINSTRFKKRLDDYQIRSIQLPLHRLTKDWMGLVKYFSFFVYEIILLFFCFRREKFDVVHVSGGVWQFKGVIAGKLAGCKVVWHLNDTKMPWVLRFLFKFLSNWFADGLIVAGKRVRQYYVDSLGVNGKLVYEIQAPVNTAYFNTDNCNYKKQVLKGSGINIVTVGNINPTKGYEHFVRMAAKLNNINGCSFHIIGPHLSSQKEYSGKLLKLKEDLGVDKLYFYGASDQIRDILMGADIYVCSSENEASPLSVWEAMSMGKPIVSTDVGDVPYLVKNGESGFIVPCGEASQLAEKVKILIEDSTLRQKFGEKGRQAAVRYLDSSRISELHRSAYCQIVGKTN